MAKPSPRFKAPSPRLSRGVETEADNVRRLAERASPPAQPGPNLPAGAAAPSALAGPAAPADPETLRKPDAPAAAPVAAGAEAPSAGRPRRRWLRPLLFALLPVALVVGGYEYVTGGAVMSTENAYVRADTVAVATDVSGLVKSVDVRDNQPVRRGEVLFRLDDEPFRLALDRAEANLGLTANDLAATKASYRDMQAQIQQQEVDLTFFQREFERQQSLVQRGVATQANFDAAQRNLQGAQQKLSSLKQQLAGIVANLSGNPDIKVEDHPRYKNALAQRDEAKRQLDHTVVKAPTDGIVTNVPSLQPGQYLAASTPSVSVVATDHVWIEAMPKETELTWVRPGQTVDVSVDTYPGTTWTGTVESISPASGSTFSLLPAQNTTGNWVKVVQRIPMRIRIETPADKPPLRVGMSVEVDVETGHARGLPLAIADLFGRKAAARTAGGDAVRN